MPARALVASVLISLSIATAAAQEIPRKAPPWTISTVDGTSIALSQYKGKTVLLAFILTTCPHCRMTVGYLAKDQQMYGPRGFQVLASATDSGVPSVIAPFVNEFHPPFPVGYNTDGNAILAFLGYSRNHLPHMPILLFIDRQGTIREQHEGSDEREYFNERQEQNLQRSIEGLLAKH
ncbi:MAG TPA: TlpA disulfide reductase family protein [Bryobacteraceae bacterium]|nr:TlpA disulfide reductase family protein [Bryobacteraceae bacterium]